MNTTLPHAGQYAENMADKVASAFFYSQSAQTNAVTIFNVYMFEASDYSRMIIIDLNDLVNFANGNYAEQDSAILIEHAAIEASYFSEYDGSLPDTLSSISKEDGVYVDERTLTMLSNEIAMRIQSLVQSTNFLFVGWEPSAHEVRSFNAMFLYIPKELWSG